MRDRWRFGDHIIMRQVRYGRVWAAFPVTVVEDGARGTTFMAPACTREEHVRVLASGQ